ncbi:filamentation (Rhf1) [Lecanosticta acicola]|uniref:Filamentation (Rhf1) n=1 Tax=Lecanosticta acicola TaxID=111012 RepID=A0AAI8Z7W0_9PEZI|nr:filamentation (Rhf1) [Lecanosticta acicola]
MSVHGKAPNPEKGARYLASLDQALCNANWAEVPELARKVDKHAPERKCLTLAARTECHVANASHRPTSASSATATSIHGLGEQVKPLSDCVKSAEPRHPDDAYIASICLAEIHWLREEPVEALNVLAVAQVSTTGKGASGPLGWLEVCAVKANFIRASCLDSSGRQMDAREAYKSAVSSTPGYRTPELRIWTERLLARACMYSVKKMPSPSLEDFGETYSAFSAWGEFWQRASSAPAGSNPGSTLLDIPRRQVWKAYYDLLSTILEHRLLCIIQPNSGPSILPSANVPTSQHLVAKQRQRTEIKRVEATYESFLLQETQFPKSSQTNIEVEEWAEQVMRNWRIFSGSDWTDADLGDGGKRGVSRATLGILYRAATKTFHSTPILRHLFTVHAARGEFDLAMHAFDSYMEIINKGKARAEKTGKHEIGFDSDDTAMLTAANAVRFLCRYGDRDHAEKAIEITKSMQKWMEQQRPSTAQSTQTNGEKGDGESRSSSQPTSALLKSTTLAAAYRASGIAQARWAQLTYESESRSSLLAEANNNIQRALKLNPDSLETAHALALVLAEMRDLAGALEVIRSTIETKDPAATVNGDAFVSSSLDRQRRLIPLWHLLALCLSAEDQFDAASRMCEAAFKQFGDPRVLFGSTGDAATTDSSNARGLVDQMESLEKESLLQIKMTQIILFELVEGADEAVDLTDELLSLYARLFGKPEHVVAEITSKPPQTASSQVPSRLGGTLRSITGSIRPRSARSSRSTRSNNGKDTPRQPSVISDDGATAAPTTNGTQTIPNDQNIGPPISITVTNEDGVQSEKPQHRHHHLPQLPFQKRGRSRSAGPRHRAPSIAEEGPNAQINEKAAAAGPDPAKAVAEAKSKPDQPMSNVAHNVGPNELPPPAGHSHQPPLQDVRLPAPHPASASAMPELHLSSSYDRRHKVTVLVNAYLFSAELYIRADTYDDADNLINAAVKLIESLEQELAAFNEPTNARTLFVKGWGNGKSIDGLWADVWATKAHLASARQRPHEAVASFEQTLSHYPDHPGGIIGLSDLLMDIYEEKLPAEEPTAPTHAVPAAPAPTSLIKEARPTLARPGTSTTLPSRRTSTVVEPEPIEMKERKVDPSPEELNRLAARDRAYMLLSNLTKQGAGWDDSEAWYTLARAHELSREIGKAKQALWWVVELEQNRSIRPLKEVFPGGYTL